LWHLEVVKDVLSASLELPTLVFTVLLAISACMWLLSLVGAIDVEIDASDGLLDDALEPLDITDVPATILITVFSLAGWFVSVLASIFLLGAPRSDGDSAGPISVIGAIGLGIGAAVVALGFVMWLSPRLALIFVTTTAPSKRELLGRIAEVRSATVTESTGRGEATWPDGTTSTVDLRTTAGTGVAPGELKRGDLALIVDWDEQADDFFVGRVPAELID